MHGPSSCVQMATTLESRLHTTQQELATVRSQLQEAVAAHAAAVRAAETAAHEAAQRQVGSYGTRPTLAMAMKHAC